MRPSNPVCEYPWQAGAVLAFTWLGSLLAQRRGDWHPEFVPSEFVFVFLGLSAVVATLVLRNCLDRALAALVGVVALCDTEAWVTNQKQFAFHGFPPLIVGAVVAAAAGMTIHIAWVPWYGLALWSFYAGVALVFGAAGQLGWSFGALLVILYRISQSNMAVEIFAWPQIAVQILTRSYLTTCGVGIVLYLVAVVAIWVSPGGSFFLTSDTGPVRQLWVLPMATMVVAYLLACQALLYRIVHRVHEQRLTALSLLIQTRFNEFLETQSRAPPHP